MDRCMMIQLISKRLSDNSLETGEQRDSSRHMVLCNKCVTVHQCQTYLQFFFLIDK